ncbi:hypothetical protein HHS34_005645 [Acidithiobacillus montserratensis]|uniref:Uncharacterized protein n=1 Tax=Acidithiobacillus montserratensis TaxID=2729135 RepID=A0ACD5HJ53_9PROT|nr:hypothetical protein [Acidithiobacillus montserratensis]MBU2747839.1 hypothetical protein [Acidithiobacillus montserratensis]
MKRIALAVTALATVAVVGAANAATVGIGYDNVGISAGPGLNMTLPGGYLTARQGLGDDFSVFGKFAGAGGKNDATFYGLRGGIGKAIPFDGGVFTPSLDMGWQRLNVGPASLRAAYAGVNVQYRYPLNREISLEANGGFGRDFSTSVTGLSTIGGLAYNAGASADFRVGPGFLNAGYSYRHLPLSGANDLHLNTGQFLIGYQMAF